MTAEEAEIAVNIANLQLENEPHGCPVGRPDPDAIPSIGPFYFIAIDEVDRGFQLRQQIVHFADIVLAVTIGIEDEVFLGIHETGNQRSPVSQVSFVVNDTNKW